MELNNSKALKTLEFNKIIDILKAKALTPTGREKCESLKPVTDIDEIRTFQIQTSQAASMIIKKNSLSLGGMKDIRPAVKRTAIGGILNIEEILHIGDFVQVSERAISYGSDEDKNDNFFILKPMFEALQPMKALSREIQRCILNDQELSDDASPELFSIRRSIKTANSRIREHLNSIIHSQTYKTYLQDSVITLRNGRFCVPVKQEYKGSFQGIVHDQSSTGATLFMEPASVVNLNNKLKELSAEEEKEIEKILARLSAMVYENEAGLLSNLEILTELDFIFAKGQLSLSMKATEPVFNDEGRIHIKKGRHPLLNPDTVVPTDIYLGKDFTTLIITGPNTGGKTVALKTIGLFTLMGQAGLHIPAGQNSELSVFENVYADIGDEQSIEQSLSTFSSHMKNIVSILDEVSYNSLVLLDELGAGTDPAEGAALAISIIQYLLDRRIVSAITTHYSEIKIYALSTDGIENASCEFDVDSLRPTYRLLIGIPGKSNAFAISRRLGLKEEIIEAAKETLSKEDKRFEDVITDLEISKKTVILEQEKAEEYRREAQKLKIELEAQREKLQSQREKIISDARLEARKVMQNAKNEADELIKEISKNMRAADGLSKADEARRKIKSKISGLSEGIKEENRPAKRLKTVKKGESVFIHSLNQRGTALSEPDSDGFVNVKAGIMKIKVNISDLSLDESEKTYTVNSRPVSSKVKAGKSMNLSPEVDLRGMMSEEAIEKTDKFLDDAYLAGMKQLTIIHGKGTGVLRAAVHNLLKGHPHVKSYRLGSFGEGETGVTICELK